MSTETITVPASIEDAKSELTGVDSLVNASEWRRAAIVYAFTGDFRGRPKSDRNGTLLTISDFAKLGIIGLRKRETVSYYRKRWADLVASDERYEIEPGDSITLPDISWREEIEDTATLDECLSDIGRMDQFAASVKRRRNELANDSQREKVASHLRIMSDSLITLAMEFENA